MSIKNIFLGSNSSVFLGWAGSTVFSGANIIQSTIHQINVLTLIGWGITSFFAILVSIYRIKQIKAETRKINSLTDKIEHDLIDIGDTSKEPCSECSPETCMYKDFYINFSPVILSKFGEEVKEDITSANNV